MAAVHLFVLGWGVSGERVKSCVVAAARLYPQLKSTTLWELSSDGAFAAGLHHSQDAIAPRKYVTQRHGEVVGFDGCLVDAQGSLNALNADVLYDQWEQLPYRVEGQFVAFKLSQRQLEVVTDPLGMHQVYYARSGNGSLAIASECYPCSLAFGP